MNFAMILSVLFMCMTVCWAGYSCLQLKYPGRGIQVIENILKKTMPFTEAIKVLQEGNRIRRKP